MLSGPGTVSVQPEEIEPWTRTDDSLQDAQVWLVSPG
jgi:hypothetical protein